jgi:hypothetical protein
MLNNGKWDNNSIINENYCKAATTTSQNINKSYGYLWWLNGKAKLPFTTVATGVLWKFNSSWTN